MTDSRGSDAGDSSDTAAALARERTRLARERTTLAHVRTGFASFIFGVALIRLFNDRLTQIIGVVFIGIGALFVVTGGYSYLKSRRRVEELLVDEIESLVER